jgi:photosystem II stability/assembly factor-like uncharacterized protein
VEDLSLRTEFRRALEVVTPPAPWLAANVRAELRRRRKAQMARQRRWLAPTLSPANTRLLAIALIVVLLVAAAGTFLVVHRFVLQPIPIHTHTGAASRMCSTGATDMITTQIGWQGTTRTTDGGTTWVDVSPPAIPSQGKGGGAVCVLDATHAWVTVATSLNNTCPQGCAGPEIDHLYVMSTADGGATWKTSQPIPASGMSLGVEYDFLDALHGWLLTDTGYYAPHRYARDLFATSNGGLHWSRVASASSGDGSALGTTAVACGATGIAFSTITTGWLTWDCTQGNGPNPPQEGGPEVVVTRDGGRTWTAVNLPSAPSTCGATPPIFSAKAGVLLTTCSGNSLIYKTADAGQTWIADQRQIATQVDFVNGTTGFFFEFDPVKKVTTLYTTTSGGADWAVVNSGLFPGRNVSSMQFIDETTGLASVSNSPVAWVTRDGGKSWSLPPPYRSVGSEICTQPTDPGAGTGPRAVHMFSTTTGWAAGARRTTDGGADWANVSPASVKLRSSVYAEFFLDATHGWVVQTAGSSTSCADRVVVFSTADGGATWQQGAPVTVAGSGIGASIDFIDASNGWLLIGSQLYRSSDGGRNWNQVAANIGLTFAGCASLGPTVFASFGPMVFSSLTTGWTQIQCKNSGPGLAVTHDGGANWTAQILAKSSCCTSTVLPTFFDPSHGLVFDSNGPAFVMTADGGHTWVRHGLPRLSYFTCVGKGGVSECSNQNVTALSFIDPNQGWAIVSNDQSGRGGPFSLTVKHTEDGGTTWISLTANLPKVNAYPDPSQSSLIFVDPSTGFLWIQNKLFTTADAGHRWTAVPVTYH